MNSLGSLPDTAALYGSVVTSVIVNWRSLLKDEQEQATQLTICLASMMGSAIALYDRTITALLCWACTAMWWEMERFRAGAVACYRLCWAWTGQSHNWGFPNSPSHSNAPQENLIRRRDRRKMAKCDCSNGNLCVSLRFTREIWLVASAHLSKEYSLRLWLQGFPKPFDHLVS